LTRTIRQHIARSRPADIDYINPLKFGPQYNDTPKISAKNISRRAFYSVHETFQHRIHANMIPKNDQRIVHCPNPTKVKTTGNYEEPWWSCSPTAHNSIAYVGI